MNKETIKEFLKPDWRKLIITFLLLLIPHPYFTIYPPGGNLIHLSTFEQIFLLPSIVPSSTCVLFFGILLLTVIVCYLFSCFVVFVYNKFKTKK